MEWVCGRCGYMNAGPICTKCGTLKETQMSGKQDGQWKDGPLPANTYGWGAVVLKGMEASGGFLFADFRGDKVVTYPGEDKGEIPGDQVAAFNNSLTLPKFLTVHKVVGGAPQE